jgi:hypothetical protein
MPLCLDAKHAETAVVVVEGDALYDAGDLLGRGSALWNGGVHELGFNFATDGWGVDDPRGSRSAAIWMPEGVQVGSGVSEALGAFVASFVGYLGVVLPS